MKSKNSVVMSGLMALVLGLGVSGTALAYRGDFSRQGPNYTPDFEAKMTDVMTRGDYEAWRGLIREKVGSTKMVRVITKENFSKFTEAWRLAKEGKIKEANNIRKQLIHDSGERDL